MTTEEALKHDPTLTPDEAAELVEAVNRYAPPRPRLTEAQERARGELAQRLADGEAPPFSLFM